MTSSDFDKDTLKDIKNSLLILIEDFSGDFFLKDRKGFSYDELMQYTDQFNYHFNLSEQINLTIKQKESIKKLYEMILQFDKSIPLHEPDVDHDIRVLKNPRWHAIEDYAKEILKLYWNIDVPLIVRIDENKLNNLDYIQNQWDIFLKTTFEIVDVENQAKKWREIEERCTTGGFIDLYYRFTVKAEVILKHPDKFDLSHEIQNSLKELIDACDILYHDVCRYGITVTGVLVDKRWKNIQKQALEFLKLVKSPYLPS